MKKIKLGKKALLIVGAVLIVVSSSFLISFRSQDFKMAKSLDIYFTLFKELNLFYVDETDPEELLKTGVNAMLESLDPYTTYIPEDELDDLRFMTTGKYGGIGAIIRKKGDYTMIVEPYENSPAHLSGLQAGDFIKKIDGKSIKGMEVSEVSNLLKGFPKTDLSLQIERPYSDKKEEIKITRKDIAVPSVSYYGMLDDEYAYIRLSGFKDNCSEDVKKAFLSMQKSDPEGLILDLRSNPGGLLIEAVKIVNLFIEKGEQVVFTKGKMKQFDSEYFTENNPIDTKIPIVVLVDRGSASASEILAGALQDLDRAVVLGQRTFGKGLVQTTRPLSYNARLKVTTAKYYIPSGRCIQALDFSHRNEDGSVGYIPDSLITEFTTRNGRKVKDGGGILPDKEITPNYLSKFSVILLTKDLIFDYATKYVSEHEKIANPESYKITDEEYKEFLAFAKDIEFDYETDSEKELTKLEEIAKKEKYYAIAKEEFDALKQKIGKDKFKDFDLFKTEVSELISEEIISRYYFQKGVIQSNIVEDKLVLEAKTVIKQKENYSQMLNGGYHPANEMAINK